uniref:Cytochrome c oxidase subunit 5B, mitochondrial n=1 Tax=Aceria tosichella TaxID=561515 RepID=A0A6G1SIL2_9ACAR
MQSLSNTTRLLLKRTGAAYQLRQLSADSIVSRNPYEELRVELDSNSSRENPMKINAYGNERTIACVCDDMHFMTLKKGPPVKCKCGYWFQLVDADKFWKKESP